MDSEEGSSKEMGQETTLAKDDGKFRTFPLKKLWSGIRQDEGDAGFTMISYKVGDACLLNCLLVGPERGVVGASVYDRADVRLWKDLVGFMSRGWIDG